MRVVFANHITDHPRRLHMARALEQAHAEHGEENAALHGFLTVGGRGQGAASDDAHRVFEIATGGVVGRRRNVWRGGGGRGRQIRWLLFGQCH